MSFPAFLQHVPNTHMTIAVGGVWLGERLLRRMRGSAVEATAAIDYRFCAAGALLPDVLDKPTHLVGIAPDGHTLGHTLIASFALLGAGAVLARIGQPYLAWLGLGSLIHLTLDPVITYPPTLLWPLYGANFDEVPIDIPGKYMRILDAVLLVASLITLWRSQNWRHRFLSFARTGSFPFADPEP